MSGDSIAAGFRGSCISVALLSALAACKPDDALSPATTRATAAPTSKDLIGVPLELVHHVNDRFAYLWTDQPDRTDYEPTPLYAYNATGGHIRITRLERGHYTVRIDSMMKDVDFQMGVSVVAQGASTIGCAGQGMGKSIWMKQLIVTVHCFDHVTGISADSPFSLLAMGPGSVLGRHAFAYANARGQDVGWYHPDTLFSWTQSPDSILITYPSAPDLSAQNVNFRTGNTEGTTVLVTAHDPTASRATCKLGAAWHESSVDVRCYDAAGSPALEKFQTIQLERGRPGRRFGFAYAHLQTTASYAPMLSRSYNSSGGPITVVRTDVGHYTITFDGLQRLPGHTENVQVTPFGPDLAAACNVVRWLNASSGTALSVYVECRGLSTGAHRDMKFNVVVIE